MSAAALLLVSVAVAAQSPGQPVRPGPSVSACSQVSADAVTDPAVGEICAGDAAARTPVAPFDSAARAAAAQREAFALKALSAPLGLGRWRALRMRAYPSLPRAFDKPMAVARAR